MVINGDKKHPYCNDGLYGNDGACNLLTYAFNNPINRMDPSGHGSELEDRYRSRDDVYLEALREVAQKNDIPFEPDNLDFANISVPQIFSHSKTVGELANELVDQKAAALKKQHNIEVVDQKTYAQYAEHFANYSAPPDTSNVSDDLALAAHIYALTTDKTTHGVISAAQASQLPITNDQAIKILKASGRTPFLTRDEQRSWITKTDLQFKTNSWPGLYARYPGKPEAEILDLENARANIEVAKTALAVDTNPAIQVYSKVFGPSASLIMMAMDLPLMVGSAFRPTLAVTAVRAGDSLEKVVQEAQAKDWAIEELNEGSMTSFATPGGLAANEARPGIPGGHVLDSAKAHVGASDADLAARMAR